MTTIIAPWKFTGSVLECQDCGALLRELTLAESAQVARDPYAYVVFCNECKADRLRQLQWEPR